MSTTKLKRQIGFELLSIFKGAPTDLIDQAVERVIALTMRASSASAGEAGTATTVQQGVVHEHAVGEAETPTPCGDTGQGMREAREELRVLMLDQPSTGRRETYSDGFAQGLSHAINRIDAALAASLSLQPDDGDRLVTITVGIDRNGDVHEDTQCHANDWADVYRGIHAVKARINELIDGRRDCPFNPTKGRAALSQNTGASMGGDNVK